ncbi:MAG TPA: (2Fe-2S)-binding protein [Polyangiaceae bacterium]|jgi:sarcosine oxidase subunit alpha
MNRTLRDPVEITHDEERVLVERGESLAAGLIAAERLLLARSPKLHRARGPYCLRGACDGCLARVNGVPNVMTCRVAARGGERIETQNILGSREHDLYAAADFLFPQGFDHHRLLAGSQASPILTALARRVSGLGSLPEQASPVRPAKRRELDCLIVGGGAAGLSAAAVLGPRALLVDDALTFGGSLALLAPAEAAASVQRARAGGAELLPHTSCLALSREPEDGSGLLSALLLGPEGAVHARCRLVLVASGGHDPTPLFGNNDLPGIFTARAALRLWRSGVRIGRRCAVVGNGRFGRALIGEMNHEPKQRVFQLHDVERAVGRQRVTRVAFKEGDRMRELSVSLVACDGPAAPSVELLVQSGASLRFDAERGYLPELGADGLAAPGLYAAGSSAGARDASQDGKRVAEIVARSLRD